MSSLAEIFFEAKVVGVFIGNKTGTLETTPIEKV